MEKIDRGCTRSTGWKAEEPETGRAYYYSKNVY